MFTEKQIKELTAKLDGNAVEQRSQAGRTFSYIEGWHAIAEANRIFGFDGWTRETIETRLVAEHQRKVGKGQYERDGWGVSYIVKVRVIATAVGTMIVREGTGAGHGIDADQGLAHESAVKEAETDAMKRAMMTFGNPFGLALYDKTQEGVEKGNGGGQQRSQAAPAIQVADNAADAKAEGLIKQINGVGSMDDLDDLKRDPDYLTLYKRLSLSWQAKVQEAGRRKVASFAGNVMAG